MLWQYSSYIEMIAGYGLFSLGSKSAAQASDENTEQSKEQSAEEKQKA